MHESFAHLEIDTNPAGDATSLLFRYGITFNERPPTRYHVEILISNRMAKSHITIRDTNAKGTIFFSRQGKKTDIISLMNEVLTELIRMHEDIQ